MLYRPSDRMALLWDTWIFNHNGTYHLFHLTRDEGKAWDRLGHAVSTDLIHWEPRPDIVLQEPGAWDGGPILTGMVFPFDGRFAMSYGSVVDGVERIGMLLSDDLETWTKHPRNPVLLPAPPYETDLNQMALPSVAWRDAFIEWNEETGFYEALVSARVPQGEMMTRGCVARARSKDLVHWEHLPPLAAPMRWQDMEVPERFFLDGHYYLIFSTAHSKGPDLDTPSRRNCSGTWYIVSSKRDHGYEVPEDPLILGSGEGNWDCYVGRFLRFGEDPLIYYHQCGPRPALSTPKKINKLADGRLTLGYWKGCDALNGEVLPLSDPSLDPIKTGPVAHGAWRVSDGAVFGECAFGPTAALTQVRAVDFQLVCDIEFKTAAKAGLLLRFDPRYGRGAGVILDRKRGEITIGRAQREHSGVVKLRVHDVYRAGFSAKDNYRLRVMAAGEFVDVYVDETLVFSSVMPHWDQEGHIGYYVDSGEVRFTGNCGCRLALPSRSGIR